MKALLIVLMMLPVSAFAWETVYSCDGSDLVIDRADTNPSAVQVVLRGQVAEWIVNETGLMKTWSLSPRGEVVVQQNATTEYGIRHYDAYLPEYLHVVKLSLENFPPRLEAETYNPKYGSHGPKQVYYFRDCRM